MYSIKVSFICQVNISYPSWVDTRIIILQGQNQSGSGGTGGDKRDDKDKKKKYEPPIPTRVGKKRRRTKGPDAAMKLPQGNIFVDFDI